VEGFDADHSVERIGSGAHWRAQVGARRRLGWLWAVDGGVGIRWYCYRGAFAVARRGFNKELRPRLSPRAPERTHSEIEKHQDNPCGNQKHSMIGSLRPTCPHAPQVWRKDDDRQQEKDAGDFKPKDAANALEGTKKAAHAASDASAGLNSSSGRLNGCWNPWGRARNWRRLRLRWIRSLRRGRSLNRGRQPLARHFAGDAQPCTQDAAKDLCSHSVYDGSSDPG